MESRTTRHTVEHAVDLGYTAPQIELVLTSDEVEREILYAGTYTGPPWTNTPD